MGCASFNFLRLHGALQAHIKIESEHSLRCSAWAAAQLYSKGTAEFIPEMVDRDRLSILEPLRVQLTAAVRYLQAAAGTTHAVQSS